MGSPTTIDIPSPEAMEDLGRLIASNAFRGAVVALNGPMGAGKTFLARAIAVGLNLPDPSIVTSPTFVLIQEYDADLPIYHFDLYRLTRDDEVRDLGVHEYYAGDGVCIVEWADKFPALMPREFLAVDLESTGTNSRRATLRSVGERHRELAAALGRGGRA